MASTVSAATPSTSMTRPARSSFGGVLVEHAATRSAASRSRPGGCARSCRCWCRRASGTAPTRRCSCSRSSRYSTSASATTPYLATQYGPRPTFGTSPANDAVNRMWPPSPCSTMRGRNASTPWIGPHRSTSIDPAPVVVGHVEDRPADGDAGVVEHDVDLARGRRTRRRPAPSRPPASARRRRPRGPRRRRRAGRRRRGRGRPARCRRARAWPPSTPSTWAVASPMPLAPPVTTAPLPLSVSMAADPGSPGRRHVHPGGSESRHDLRPARRRRRRRRPSRSTGRRSSTPSTRRRSRSCAPTSTTWRATRPCAASCSPAPGARSAPATTSTPSRPARGAPQPMLGPETVSALEELPQPTIAKIKGHCFTGGLELALACDFLDRRRLDEARRHPRAVGHGADLGHVDPPARARRPRQRQGPDVHRPPHRRHRGPRRSGSSIRPCPRTSSTPSWPPWPARSRNNSPGTNRRVKLLLRERFDRNRPEAILYERSSPHGIARGHGRADEAAARSRGSSNLDENPGLRRSLR